MRLGSLVHPAAMLALVLALCLVGHAACQEIAGDVSSLDGSPLVLVSGPEDGEYYELALALSDLLRKQDIRILVRPSGGSRDNLEALRNQSAHLALIQSNVLEIGKTPVQPLLTVCTELVHLVTRPALVVSRLEQVIGKRVFLGLDGSGGLQTAIDILGAAGVSDCEVAQQTCASYTQAVDMLAADSLDVAFFTIRYPADVLRAPLRNRTIRLNPMGRSLVKTLKEKSTCYLSARIPDSREDYDFGFPVPTIGLRTILVAAPGVPDDLAYAVTRTVFDGWRVLGLRERPGIDACYTAAQYSLHPGAKRYYTESRLRRLFLRFNVDWLTVLVPVAALVFVLIRFRKMWWVRIRSQPVLAGLLLLILGWTLIGLALYVSERDVNDDFRTPSSALLSVLVYLFSGIEDKYPSTMVGWMLTVLVMVLSAGAFAVIYAWITAWWTENRLRGKKMSKRQTDHFVICNCDSRIFPIIRELRNHDPSYRVPVVILAPGNEIPEYAKKANDFFGEVSIVEGSPTDTRALTSANAHWAKCVVILAPRLHESTGGRGSPETRVVLDDAAADARSIMTLLAMKKVCEEEAGSDEGPRYAPCVVEILDQANMEIAWQIGTLEIARGSGREEGGKKKRLSFLRRDHGHKANDHGLWGGSRWVQVVSGGEIQTLLLCQAAYTPGVVQFFRTLMTFAQESSEVYVRPLPKVLTEEETLFREAAMWITAASRKKDDDNPMIPVGLQMPDGTINTNPQGRIVLKDNQRLILIALDPPNLEDLDPEMLRKERERRKSNA